MVLIKFDNPETSLSDIFHSWLTQRLLFGMAEWDQTSLFQSPALLWNLPLLTWKDIVARLLILCLSQKCLELEGGRSRTNQAGANTTWLLRIIHSLKKSSPVTSLTSMLTPFKMFYPSVIWWVKSEKLNHETQQRTRLCVPFVMITSLLIFWKFKVETW